MSNCAAHSLHNARVTPKLPPELTKLARPSLPRAHSRASARPTSSSLLPQVSAQHTPHQLSQVSAQMSPLGPPPPPCSNLQPWPQTSVPLPHTRSFREHISIQDAIGFTHLPTCSASTRTQAPSEKDTVGYFVLFLMLAMNLKQHWAQGSRLAINIS